ncbi:MAG: linear amide C-N hydrolase [Micropruina sp.]|nr:MAG: linear amide C-N hydrolase [Micropruina sp.]
MAVSRRVLLAGGAALGLTGCVGGTSQPAGGVTSWVPQSGASTPAVAASSASEPVRRLRLEQTAAERARTQTSLVQLDDHPLYRFEWFGRTARVDSATSPSPVPVETHGFGCTLFAGFGGTPIVGRNFDWDPAPATLIRVIPSDGPRSLVMMDARYLGAETDLMADRAPLLRGAGGVVDGINEHGLFVGLAADETAHDDGMDALPGRPTVGSLAILRLILDRARSVAQAINVASSYNIDFTGGPLLHYFLADSSGDAAVLEVHGRRLVVVPKAKDRRWACLENFHLADTPEDRRRNHACYGACARALTASDGLLTTESAFGLLDEVR